METKGRDEENLARQVSAVREFNRFYTARLGLLRRRHLDGEFSLTESRILYEIGAQPGTTASTLCTVLELDAGYMSRLVAMLTRKRLVRATASKTDGREKHLKLTPAGEKIVARLNEKSDRQIEEMLAAVGAENCERLVASLRNVRAILSDPRKAEVRIVRLTDAPEEALEILEEYYEAVHVVQRDKPGMLQRLVQESGSGMWLAWLGDQAVGCVVLRKMASIPRAGECKRLYVRPSARGLGIADKLLDAQEEYAQQHRLHWIYLDTYDDLTPAIALYEKRGYRRCERYNDNPQATVFMRKRIGS